MIKLYKNSLNSIRKFVSKNKVGLGLLFGLEALISAISIPISINNGEDFFLNLHRQAYISSSYLLEELNYNLGEEINNLENILNNPKTKESFKKILNLKILGSEVGGMVLIKNSPKKYLEEFSK